MIDFDLMINLTHVTVVETQVSVQLCVTGLSVFLEGDISESLSFTTK